MGRPADIRITTIKIKSIKIKLNKIINYNKKIITFAPNIPIPSYIFAYRILFYVFLIGHYFKFTNDQKKKICMKNSSRNSKSKKYKKFLFNILHPVLHSPVLLEMVQMQKINQILKKKIEYVFL